jgi:hypothetical protein
MKRHPLLALALTVAVTGAVPTVALAATPSHSRPPAQHRASASWAVRVPHRLAAGSVALDGVACPDPTECVAVGASSATASAVIDTALANGTATGSWRALAGAQPAGTTSSSLQSVSCATVDFCAAVGNATDATGTHMLAETYDGNSWTPTVLPDPAGYVAQQNEMNSTPTLSGVDCWAVGECVAVGESPADQEHEAVVETLSGGAWTQTALPSVGYAQLMSVSCAVPGRCTAVGSASSVTGSSVSALLVETLDDGTWAAQQIDSSTSGAYEELSSVSCPRPSHCLAVGREGYLAGDPAEYGSWGTFAVAGTPGGWQPETSLTGTAFSAPNSPWAVHCTGQNRCMAVGANQFGSPSLDATAQRYVAGSWGKARDLATDADRARPLLAVDCPSGGECVAVGGTPGQPIVGVWHPAH